MWLKNKAGKFLSQQRAETVRWPLMWCANGGNAKMGEDSYTCAKREIEEELGLDITKLNGGLFDKRIYEEDNQSYFCDSYLYDLDIDINTINFQKEEIKKLDFFDIDTIIEMMNKGEYFVYDLDYLEYLKKYSKQNNI